MLRTLKLYFDHHFAEHLKTIKAKFIVHHKLVTLGEWVMDDEDALEWDDYLTGRETAKWRRRAWKHRLEMPPDNPKAGEEGPKYWRAGHRTHDSPFLNQAGIRFILDQYRLEKAAQRDAIIKWATLIFAAIGAFVAIYKL